jgi:predicted AlkP superfamily phosphohydrolase/phosphomutase
MRVSRKGRPKVCIIGLDGVPVGLLRRLLDDGVLPATAHRFGRTPPRPMKASLPEVSAVSWSSFMTGRDPGGHGIFGFTDFAYGSYALRFPNFRDLKASTLWDRLGDRGYRSIVINQPATYPAQDIPGVLVSGFVSVERDRAIRPERLQPVLETLDYRIDVDMARAAEDHDFLLRDLHQTLAGRYRLLTKLAAEEPWDLLQVVVTGTDRLHHFLWVAGEEADHPRHQAFLDYYRAVDEFIAKTVEIFCAGGGDPETALFMLSDHGFGRSQHEVFLNAWLAQEGLLKFSDPDPQSHESIAAGTKAFALDPGRIYLHRRSRFPRGEVGEEECRGFKTELRERLRTLTLDGKPVIAHVFDANDIYTGPHAAEGPDLVLVSERGFDLKGSVKSREIFGPPRLSGMHTWDDAFFWCPDPPAGDLAIHQLAELILAKFPG